jgi:hypothetical protein
MLRPAKLFLSDRVSREFFEEKTRLPFEEFEKIITNGFNHFGDLIAIIDSYGDLEIINKAKFDKEEQGERYDLADYKIIINDKNIDIRFFFPDEKGAGAFTQNLYNLTKICDETDRKTMIGTNTTGILSYYVNCKLGGEALQWQYAKNCIIDNTKYIIDNGWKMGLEHEDKVALQKFILEFEGNNTSGIENLIASGEGIFGKKIKEEGFESDLPKGVDLTVGMYMMHLINVDCVYDLREGSVSRQIMEQIFKVKDIQKFNEREL